MGFRKSPNHFRDLPPKDRSPRPESLEVEGVEMFDVFQRGNYTGSLDSWEDVLSAMREIFEKIGPEEFDRKRLTAIRSVHFRTKSE